MDDPVAGAEAEKPLPKDLSHLYSDVTKARVPSSMKQYYKYFQIPGISNLAGGLPNAQFFPFDTLEAQTAKPNRWTPTPNHPGAADHSHSSSSSSSSSRSSLPPPSNPRAASHLVVPHDAAGASDPTTKIDLATALQYGQADGYPPLLSFVRQFAREYLHPNVPYRGGPEVILTVGATDGMSKALELFTNIWIPGKNDVRERPGMLTEVFMYANAAGQAASRGVQVVPVEMDGEGMVPYGPGGLDDVLANWDDSKGKRPHLLYTVTIGHNPTSGVLSLQRRREIYALCSKYDVIIVEDDPYWYLQYPSAELEEAKARHLPVPELKEANTLEKKSGYPFLDSLAPSFLSVDVDGRVVRLDTFSKTVAPGCRLGWVTATPQICERILRISESGTQQPSGFVQVVIAESIMGPQPEAATKAFSLFSRREQASFRGWKMDGWVRWLEGLRGEYERRMNRMCRILEDNACQLKQQTPLRKADADWGVITKTQLYDFSWPRGGMFLWLHVRFETHPLWKAAAPGGGGGGGGGKVLDGPALSMALMLFLTRKPYIVLVSPGAMFAATDRIRAARAWAYYRLCFAAETDDNVDSATLRLARGIHRFWRIKDPREIEDLLRELDGGQPPETAEEEEEGAAGGLANLGSIMGC
ncbi:pyridoxal phosphate-dependent transferase [Biscogniauxia mediterranea]|nr:pyridoxal phosphate-dependent transferase [Biscogniauxia mediterranea]